MVSNGESVIECTLCTLNINKYSHLSKHVFPPNINKCFYLSKKYVLLTLTSIPT